MAAHSAMIVSVNIDRYVEVLASELLGITFEFRENVAYIYVRRLLSIDNSTSVMY